jgi:hypothetical protein
MHVTIIKTTNTVKIVLEIERREGSSSFH